MLIAWYWQVIMGIDIGILHELIWIDIADVKMIIVSVSCQLWIETKPQLIQNICQDKILRGGTGKPFQLLVRIGQGWHYMRHSGGEADQRQCHEQ